MKKFIREFNVKMFLLGCLTGVAILILCSIIKTHNRPVLETIEYGEYEIVEPKEEKPQHKEENDSSESSGENIGPRAIT